MWDRDENRLAMVELIHEGRLSLRERQRAAWNFVVNLPWTRTTGRRDELEVVPSFRTEIENMLDRRWPEWRVARRRLVEAGLPVTHEGWKQLLDRDRAAQTVALPPRLNKKTAAAYVGPHSKVGFTDVRRLALDGIDITRDGIVRLRPNRGLVLATPSQRVVASRLVAVAGEVVLNERALKDGTRLTGVRPRAVLTVENLGPYMDVPAPEDWMVVHVPGWNSPTAKRILDQLEDIPILHFGDLDPDGAKIVHHLRRQYPRLQWAVPGFWSECLPDRAQRKQWPGDLDLTDAPSLVQELKDAGLWLEQETITLDSRLPRALEHAVISL